MHEGIIIRENIVSESFIDGLLSQTNYYKSNKLPVRNESLTGIPIKEDEPKVPTGNHGNHRCRIVDNPILNDDVITEIFIKANNEHFKLDIDWEKCTPVSYIKKYTEGDAGFITWHDDILPDAHPDYGYRALSMSIILEDQFEGGEMEFKNSWEDEDVIQIPKLKKNQAIIFKPQLPHKVSLVTEGTRTALVTWLFSKEDIYA